jgi:flagellar basal-body rod modification protein FlgD
MQSLLADVASAPYDPTGGASTGGGPMDSDSFGKDSFLKLLTTQLANQDPLAPSESTQFIAQLAQFSSLEQLVNVNEGLDLLAVTQTAATSAQMVSYVGKQVTFASDSIYMTEPGQDQTISYELGGPTDHTTVQVLSEEGEVVRTLELMGQEEGDQRVDFDGNDNDGNPLPEGLYTLEVSAKKDDGDVLVKTRDKAVVKGVTFKGGFPQLLLEDGRIITLNQVLSVMSADGEEIPLDPSSGSVVDDAIEAAEKIIGDLTANSEDVFDDMIPDTLDFPPEIPGDTSDDASDYDAESQ